MTRTPFIVVADLSAILTPLHAGEKFLVPDGQAPEPGKVSAADVKSIESRNQKAPMRDGVQIAVDIFRPDGDDLVEWIAKQSWCNGLLVSTNAGPQGGGHSGSVQLGRANTGGSFTGGSLDEFRIYSRCLSVEDVKTLSQWKATSQ